MQVAVHQQRNMSSDPHWINQDVTNTKFVRTRIDIKVLLSYEENDSQLIKETISSKLESSFQLAML